MLSPLRFVCANDDHQTFTCITPSNYYIFSVTPFKIHYSKSISEFSIGSAATCSGYRLIAISGLPADPQFDTKCVIIYDHSKEKQDVFYNRFPNHILSMRVSPVFFICAFHDHIEVWQIETCQRLHQISNAVNVHAPIDISSDFRYLSCSGTTPLEVAVCSLLDFNTNQYKAADNQVSLVKFSQNDRYFATTSSAGHAIKVWNPDSGECVAKFKRGNTASVIHSIDFSPTNDFIAVISQNGTLHFFDMRNRKSGGSVSTVRSMHRISLEDTSFTHVAWLTKNRVAVTSLEGKMIVFTIDDGTCQEVAREQVMFYLKLIEMNSS